VPRTYTLEEARKVFPPMWTIYEKPKDFPEKWVVRMWYGETPHPRAAACDSLKIARDLIREVGGCVLIPRLPNDDPCVVETWL
jgi:hypothetical protein